MQTIILCMYFVHEIDEIYICHSNLYEYFIQNYRAPYEILLKRKMILSLSITHIVQTYL